MKFDEKNKFLFMIIVAAAMVCYGYYEAKDVRTREISVPADKLPENVQAIRIVQISDLHIGRDFDPDRLVKVIKIVDAAAPDLIVLTGDIVDRGMMSEDYYIEKLSSMKARLGRFAVTGNHELYSGVDRAVGFMRRAGYIVLRSEWRDIGPLVIAGVDDKGGWVFSEQYDGYDLLSTLPEDARRKFVLFLKHRPQVHPGSIGLFDLQLSGHTHGGQIWPLVYLTNHLHGIKQGLSVFEGGALYVSNGTGHWGPPIRFFTPPEVTIINVVRAQ
ncbi:MAG: metallophosphoesterase [Synergistaceae bacterium]|nr:metallophosphoesterase [Synergistaceae bacterium]